MRVKEQRARLQAAAQRRVGEIESLLAERRAASARQRAGEEQLRKERIARLQAEVEAAEARQEERRQAAAEEQEDVAAEESRATLRRLLHSWF